MRNAIIRAVAFAALLGGCATTPGQTGLSSPAGQIFCAIQTQGGGQIVVGLVDATATADTGAAAPLVALGAAATQSYLNQQCSAAAAKVSGATGSTGAVPAPAMPVKQVPITPVTPAAWMVPSGGPHQALLARLAPTP